MAPRDELKSLIDQIPEDKLKSVRMNLESILHPRPSNPVIEKMERRSEEIRKQLPERLKQLQAGNRPGMSFGFIGGDSFAAGPAPHKGSGECAHTWREGRAHVKHKLLFHEDREIDIVERLEITEDERTLVYEQEIFVEGRSVKRREEFTLTSQ